MGAVATAGSGGDGLRRAGAGDGRVAAARAVRAAVTTAGVLPATGGVGAGLTTAGKETGLAVGVLVEGRFGRAGGDAAGATGGSVRAGAGDAGAAGGTTGGAAGSPPPGSAGGVGS